MLSLEGTLFFFQEDTVIVDEAEQRRLWSTCPGYRRPVIGQQQTQLFRQILTDWSVTYASCCIAKVV